LQSLAFIYSTGIKVRNWFDGSDRKVWWLMGGTSIWRADRMVGASKVFVCEGETDCISLVDAGFENDPAVAVVAVPSASTFHPSWAPLFASKVVTLCMDSDPAGQIARQKIGALIHPYAAALKTINPGEVQ
jgi:DNA primase